MDLLSEDKSVGGREHFRRTFMERRPSTKVTFTQGLLHDAMVAEA